VRNATAWGNAPDKVPANPEALKAPPKAPLLPSSFIPRLQRFDQNPTVTWAVGPGFYITRL